MADPGPTWLTSTESTPAPTTVTTAAAAAATTTTSKKTTVTATKNSNNSKSSTSSSNGSNGGPNFKVTLIGDAGVGKTALFTWLRHQEHGHHDAIGAATSTCCTVGVDTCSRTFSTRYGNVTITLWDTAGVERYRTLTRNYYRNTNAALLVCSVDSTSTLFSLPRWQRDVVESAPSALYFLLGNKSDLEGQVSDDTLKSFADSHNCEAAFLTSAKTGDGIEEALISVCEKLMDSHHHTSVTLNKDDLWLQGSGLHVHGSDEHEYLVPYRLAWHGVGSHYMQSIKFKVFSEE